MSPRVRLPGRLVMRLASSCFDESALTTIVAASITTIAQSSSTSRCGRQRAIRAGESARQATSDSSPSPRAHDQLIS